MIDPEWAESEGARRQWASLLNHFGRHYAPMAGEHGISRDAAWLGLCALMVSDAVRDLAVAQWIAGDDDGDDVDYGDD